MKPFDLERALAGDPVVTRDGRKVTEIHYFKTLEDRYFILAVIDGSAHHFKENGRRFDFECDCDLLMYPITKKYYIPIFIDVITNTLFTRRMNLAIEDLDEWKLAGNYVKTISFETVIE
jgi:hypothetical protein